MASEISLCSAGDVLEYMFAEKGEFTQRVPVRCDADVADVIKTFELAAPITMGSPCVVEVLSDDVCGGVRSLVLRISQK